jgi:tetratricopeptide (TPR) repeat protein
MRTDGHTHLHLGGAPMDEPTCHPDHATLERYSRSELSSAESTRIEEHLRSGCARCQSKVDDFLLGLERGLRDTPERRVDAGWDRLFAGLGRRLSLAQREREVAPQLVAELVDAPEAERDGLIEALPQLRSPAVCDLLLERSFGQGFEQPAQAVELAGLAVRIAEQLDPGFYGRSLVQDLRTRAWAHLGNARRLASDFPGAEQALTIAESHLEGGSTDPLEEARVLDFKASLLSDRGWFEEAADLIEVIIEIYGEIRDSHRQGRAQISKGVFLGYAGRAEEAVELISAGLARIDRDQGPRLVLMAHHNLAWFLNDCGRSAEAIDLLESFRTTYHEFQDPWTRHRLVWLEGRIAFGLGQYQEAEAGLGRARKGFLAQGLGYEASMVTLDLASLYLHQGRTAEVKSLAQEMLPHFLSQDIHRQAVIALATFQRAAEMDRVTPHLVRDLAAYLMRAQRNPGLRFQ